MRFPIVAFFMALLFACTPAPTPVPTVSPSRVPTATQAPTVTPTPTETPVPTSTVPSWTSPRAQDVVPFDFRAPTPVLEQGGAPTSCPDGCIVVPDCPLQIKGNIGFSSSEKIYHMPDQEYYPETVIDPTYGERWFCTEEEAISNGWRKTSR